jgi:hypothetical protein
LKKEAQETSSKWNSLTDDEKEGWNARARALFNERAYVSDEDERRLLFNKHKSFIDSYVEDISKKLGMAVIFYAVPAKSGSGLSGILAHSVNATLSAAKLEREDFAADMLLNVNRPIRLEGMDQKDLDPLYRQAFHDLMKQSKSFICNA